MHPCRSCGLCGFLYPHIFEDKLSSYMDIDKQYINQLHDKLRTLEEEMSQPEISSNPQKMKPHMQAYAHTKKETQAAEHVYRLRQALAEAEELLQDADQDAELLDMARQEKKRLRNNYPQPSVNFN